MASHYAESLYLVLGVSEDASTQEIKQAYRKAALRTHPDRALPERKAEAEANFKRIAEAYEVLSQSDSRRRYDMLGGTTWSPSASSRPSASCPTTSPPPTDASSHTTYFGTSPDSKPFTFQWESSHDSARRAQAQRAGRGNTFNRRPFNSVDPFELFNQMFQQELHSAHNVHASLFDDHPFFSTHQRMMPEGVHAQQQSSAAAAAAAAAHVPVPRAAAPPAPQPPVQQPPPVSPFGMFGVMPPMPMMPPMPIMQPMFPSLMQPMAWPSHDILHGGGGGGGKFQSESIQTCTVNGRTETIIRRTDSEGNETVIRQVSE